LEPAAEVTVTPPLAPEEEPNAWLVENGVLRAERGMGDDKRVAIARQRMPVRVVNMKSGETLDAEEWYEIRTSSLPSFENGGGWFSAKNKYKRDMSNWPETLYVKQRALSLK
jgi:hypothetical protein